MSSQKLQGRFSNAVFIAHETFLVEEELARLKQQLGENISMNWATFNAEESPAMNEIINLCNTMPFLSEQRVVIIKNGHKLSAKQLDQVLLYLENPCDITTFILIMEVEKTDKDLNKLIKRFDGKAQIVRFESIKNRGERINWIMERTPLHGKKIDKDAAVLLADMTGGSSMWYLDSEIQKLCLYVAQSLSITGKDVHEAVMRTHEPAIFAFLDALFDRKKDALSRLYELELSGVTELEIISRIENQIINHYVVLSGRDWKKMKIHDFVADKAMRRKSSWSIAQLTTLLKDVRGIEQKLKSSSLIHVYAALTELIGRLVLSPRNEGRISGRP
jgi:DNA polymerase-3 subunit delta